MEVRPFAGRGGGGNCFKWKVETNVANPTILAVDLSFWLTNLLSIVLARLSIIFFTLFCLYIIFYVIAHLLKDRISYPSLSYVCASF